MRVGLLLPHFSEHCTWDRMIGLAAEIERLGFDSVWARDNLAFTGHGFELPGNRFVDPFIGLAAIAGRTERLGLGTAVTIPFRHPVETAQLVGSLGWASRGRFELGVGPGTPSKPFELTGIPYEARIQLCKETVEVLRALSAGAPCSYAGEITAFDDTLIDPPPDPDLTVWYGGASGASIRRTLEYCDGLLPGRCPFSRYDVAIQRLADGAERAGRSMPKLGAIPLVSVGRDRADALGKIAEALPDLLTYLSGHWRSSYDSVDQLDGALVAGSSQDVAEQLREFDRRGFELVVLDTRLSMPEYESVVRQLGEEVLPLLLSSAAAEMTGAGGRRRDG